MDAINERFIELRKAYKIPAIAGKRKGNNH